MKRWLIVQYDTDSELHGLIVADPKKTLPMDLFYEEYDDVISFPTGYYDVYSVWYEEVNYYPYGDVILNDIWEVI